MSKLLFQTFSIIVFLCTFVLTIFPASARDLKDSNLTPEITLKLILVDKLRSGDSKRNDRVNYKVDEDIADQQGNILIKKGTPAYGTVINSRRNGMWGKRGALDVSVEYTTAIDGQRVPLRASKEKRGGGSQSLMTAGAILVAWPLAFCKGSNVSIEPGTTFVAYVDENLLVDSSRDNKSLDMNRSNGITEISGPEKSIVMINGDRLSGQILGLQNGVYSIKTRMGTLSIRENEIKTIESVTIQAVQNPGTASGSPAIRPQSDLEKRIAELKSKKRK